MNSCGCAPPRAGARGARCARRARGKPGLDQQSYTICYGEDMCIVGRARWIRMELCYCIHYTLLLGASLLVASTGNTVNLR